VIRLELRDGAATVTLASPESRNAMSARLVANLGEAIAAALADDGVRVIVLTHEGPVFCAGADLKEPPPPGAAPALLTALWSAPKPVVARVAGHVRAGGVGLVAACDVVVASREATFALTEVRLGLVPAIISQVVIPRLGMTRALDLFLTGESIDGEAAAAAGLVTLATDDVDAAVERVVERLKLGAPGALAATKRLLRPPLDFGELERLSAEAFAGEEGREGIAAFLEKRPPAWAG